MQIRSTLFRVKANPPLAIRRVPHLGFFFHRRRRFFRVIRPFVKTRWRDYENILRKISTTLRFKGELSVSNLYIE